MVKFGCVRDRFSVDAMGVFEVSDKAMVEVMGDIVGLNEG